MRPQDGMSPRDAETIESQDARTVTRPRLRSVLACSAVLVSLAANLACAPEGDGPSIPSDSIYVELMARLSYLDVLGAERDSVWLDSARSATLAERGVDPEALVAYAERHGADAGHMAQIWEATARRMFTIDSLARLRDSLPARSGPADRAATDSAPDNGSGGAEDGAP